MARYEVTAEVPDELQHCPTHGPRTLLPESMWDTTEKLEFRRLSDIEDRGKRLADDARLALRQAEAKPIWDAMERRLAELQERTSQVILPKSDFGKALQYLRNHWVELRRYLDDPAIPFDNNAPLELGAAASRSHWPVPRRGASRPLRAATSQARRAPRLSRLTCVHFHRAPRVPHGTPRARGDHALREHVVVAARHDSLLADPTAAESSLYSRPGHRPRIFTSPVRPHRVAGGQ